MGLCINSRLRTAYKTRVFSFSLNLQGIPPHWHDIRRTPAFLTNSFGKRVHSNKYNMTANGAGPEFYDMTAKRAEK